jgi:hypothetical protein
MSTAPGRIMGNPSVKGLRKKSSGRVAAKPPVSAWLRSRECNGDIPLSGLAEGIIPLRADGAKE